MRIAPDTRMAVVGAPSYFRSRSEPMKPQDLVEHNCINLRLPTHGGLYAWEFEKGSRQLKVRVEGQLYFSTTTQMLHGGLAGMGLTYLPEGRFHFMRKSSNAHGFLAFSFPTPCLPPCG